MVQALPIQTLSRSESPFLMVGYDLVGMKELQAENNGAIVHQKIAITVLDPYRPPKQFWPNLAGHLTPANLQP